MNLPTQRKSTQGFTLIELLIVIVIIGILAGVLVTTINPADQQNKARDAGIKAAMNKLALSAKAHVSAYGVAPDGEVFFESLTNATISGWCSTNQYYCRFSLANVALPTSSDDSACGRDESWHKGSQNCYFFYNSYTNNNPNGWPPERFQIIAKSFGDANKVFIYSYWPNSDIDGVYTCRYDLSMWSDVRSTLCTRN